jgi:hypothetical protein
MYQPCSQRMIIIEVEQRDATRDFWLNAKSLSSAQLKLSAEVHCSINCDESRAENEHQSLFDITEITRQQLDASASTFSSTAVAELPRQKFNINVLPALAFKIPSETTCTQDYLHNGLSNRSCSEDQDQCMAAARSGSLRLPKRHRYHAHCLDACRNRKHHPLRRCLP